MVMFLHTATAAGNMPCRSVSGFQRNITHVLIFDKENINKNLHLSNQRLSSCQYWSSVWHTQQHSQMPKNLSC